jgi:hypothetical protein
VSDEWASCRPLNLASSAPQSPARQNRAGRGGKFSRRSIEHEPRLMAPMLSPPPNRHVAGASQESELTERVTACGDIRDQLLSTSATEIRCDGTFSFSFAATAQPASWFSKPTRQFPTEPVSQTLNAQFHPCQISLHVDGQNRTHPRPRQWLWLVGDGFASCPLLQRLAQSFSPCYAFLAHQETPRPAVLHCVPAFQVQRSKPLPQTSHRGRE